MLNESPTVTTRSAPKVERWYAASEVLADVEFSNTGKFRIVYRSPDGDVLHTEELSADKLRDTFTRNMRLLS